MEVMSFYIAKESFLGNVLVAVLLVDCAFVALDGVLCLPFLKQTNCMTYVLLVS
jgi:hypothetical protein